MNSKVKMHQVEPTAMANEIAPAASSIHPKGYRNLTWKEAARKTPPTTITDTEALIDMERMRLYRLGRIREQLQKQDLAACVLLTPYSIRYATGLRNCALYQTHILAGYLFVPAEGPTVLFDSQPGRFTGQHLETIEQIREDVLPLSFMWASQRMDEWVAEWAKQMADLVRKHGQGNRRLAIEWAGSRAPRALEQLGMEVFDAAEVVDPARAIKCPEEILCLNQVIAVAEDGMWRMRHHLRPGITELDVWSHLWQANIEAGGDWIECRLLSSGDRTNPWQQETSSRKIRAGDLLVFDTDMVGPFGYFADISRAFFCEPGTPTAQQKELYQRAHQEIHHNIELMRPGMSFRELTEKSFRQPAKFRSQHYPVMAHGVGMSDEWPAIYYPEDARFIFDGELEPGMVMAVESYIGAVGGREGVKLEQMVLITEDGYELLSTFPFEDALLS